MFVLCYKFLIYRGFNSIATNAHHLRLLVKSPPLKMESLYDDVIHTSVR